MKKADPKGSVNTPLPKAKPGGVEVGKAKSKRQGKNLRGQQEVPRGGTKPTGYGGQFSR